MRCPIGLESARNVKKRDFSELSLPGVEIVPIPCASMLRTTRASHLQYNAKSEVTGTQIMICQYMQQSITL